MNEMEINQVLYNNLPVEDYCGLSSNEIEGLVTDSLNKGSLVYFAKDIDDGVLDNIPYFRLTELFLHIIKREGAIPLTPAGTLPVCVMNELYDYHIFKDDPVEKGYAKFDQETESLIMNAVHITSRLGGLIKKLKGQIFLTKKGEKLIDHRSKLFKNVFETFFNKFNIGYQDNFTPYAVGQIAWAYSMFLLHKFGDKGYGVRKYCDLYIKAFPDILSIFAEHKNPRNEFLKCYVLRFFEKSLRWFGFIKLIRKARSSKLGAVVEPTEILSKVIVFDIG